MPLIALLESQDYLVIGGIVFVATCVAAVVTRQRVDLRRVERKLDALLQQQGVELPCALSQEVQRLARQGQKIEAIRLHREQTGISLREAKEAVEDAMG